MEQHIPPRLSLFVIQVCFFFSGAAGLIYQVAWGKALGLVFGNTVYAVATVLAVFMGGLAMGSAVMGRWSEARSNPVALYGWVELGVAAAGALSLVGLAGVRALYVATHPLVSGWLPALVALRFIGAALVLFLPTFLMGGTLPILVRGLTRSSAELGARVSRLYWVNTLGATAGTFLAGFVLLPTIGLRLTVACAVGLNVFAGVVALALARGMASQPAEAPVDLPPPSSAEPAGLSRFLLGTFAAVGATAIAYEVCWTRLLSSILGSSTYAFTLMLGTFLAGIVIGSLVFELWQKRGHPVTLATYATTQTLTALAALAFLVFFQRMPELVPPILRATQQSFGGLVLMQLAISALAMLPAAVVFGFNFPVVTLLIAGRPESSGHHAAAVGRAYAANTLGAILGATVTGFWLVPLLGAFRLVALAAAANLALAVVLQLRRTPRSVPALALPVALLLFVSFIGVTGAFYNRDLATFGSLVYWDLYNDKLSLAEAAATNDVIFAEDGLNASISVARAEDYVGLRNNGKVDASNRDVITQLLLGHLGGIFHPAPKRALIIGFGSGMSAASLAAYPELERIDVVEIEPAVIRAARHLESLNRGVLRDPRVHVTLDDARNFLLTSRDKYDLILSEPSNPWIAGVATLFTEEYYREARARLAPGGIFVQWVQAYSLFPEDFRMILATFAPHFEQLTLWRGESADFFIVGQTVKQPLTLDRLRALWSRERLRADYEQLGMRTPEGLIAFHRLDDADLRKLMAGSLINTDNHTRLEYNAPRALLVSGIDDKNREAVWAQRSSLLPQDVRIADPNTALAAAAETLLNLEENEEAEYFLNPLASEPPTAAIEILRGRISLWRNQFTEARKAFQNALNLDRTSLAAVHGIGEAARKQLDYDSAELLFRQVLARDPKHVPALESLVRLTRSQSRWQDAADYQGRVIIAKPHPTAADYAHLGEILMNTGETAVAEGFLLKALEDDPYIYLAHRKLGELYKNTRQWDQARAHFEHILRFAPDSDSEDYILFTEICRMQGRPKDAEKALRKGRRIFPDDQALRKAPGS